MKNNFILVVLFFALIIPFLDVSQTQATTILSFDSSEQSWVGQGQSLTITPEDGYIFDVYDYRESITFLVYNPSTYWRLNFSAPEGQILEIGHYSNVVQYTFDDFTRPALSFTGDGRGNSTISGFFDIFEIIFDATGNLTKFAADFTQYGEQNIDWWINGKIRFNSDIPLELNPVPEPTTLLMFSIGISAIFLLRKKKKT